MKLSAKTETGKTRTENQDDYRAALMPDGSCWAAVCDGMGGVNGGKLASTLAIAQTEAACMEFVQTAHTAKEQKAFLSRLYQNANKTVYGYWQEHADYKGMGTTMVCALVQGDLCTVASIGDSRAYLLRDNQLTQITHDHSVVQHMVDQGLLDQTEAEDYPFKNVITKAVGAQKDIEPDLFQFQVSRTDMLLLCTDGLTNAVATEDIVQCINTAPFYEVAPRLLERVLAQPEQDNATVLLIDLS